tara:strand:+ start:1749 stop:1961 length:213 start_codon:yes stop_codon:yes gene_type:complete
MFNLLSKKEYWLVTYVAGSQDRYANHIIDMPVIDWLVLVNNSNCEPYVITSAIKITKKEYENNWDIDLPL